MRIEIETFEAIKRVAGSFQVDSESNGFFTLRFGYWQRKNVDDIQSVLPEYLAVHEEDHHDEDCGYLFHYVIKHKGQWVE